MPQHFPLVVAIRCHRWPHLVVDTIASVFHHATTFPLVVIASDGNAAIPDVVQQAFPQVRCFVSPHKWGWGAGLYGLLAETINWLDSMEDITYGHFLSIDYDTLIIGRGFDEVMLKHLKREGAGVGLAGSYVKRSANWRARYMQNRKAIRRIVNTDELPEDYEPGESTLGGFMWLTPDCLAAMREKGYFSDPYRDIRNKIDLYDDPWTCLLVRSCGFSVLDTKRMLAGNYAWIAWSDPGPWQSYLRKGLKVFNLARISRGNDKTQEILTRNVFRQDRAERMMLGPDAAQDLRLHPKTAAKRKARKRARAR